MELESLHKKEAVGHRLATEYRQCSPVYPWLGPEVTGLFCEVQFSHTFIVCPASPGQQVVRFEPHEQGRERAWVCHRRDTKLSLATVRLVDLNPPPAYASYDVFVHQLAVLLGAFSRPLLTDWPLPFASG